MNNYEVENINKFKTLYNNFFKDINKRKIFVKNINLNSEFYTIYEIEAMLLRLRFFCFTNEGDHFWKNLNNTLKNNNLISAKESSKSFKELLKRKIISKKIFVKKGKEDIQKILNNLNIKNNKEKSKIILYENISYSFIEDYNNYHYINTGVDFLELLLYSKFYHFNRTAIIIIESMDIKDLDIYLFLQEILEIFINQINLFYNSIK